MKNLKKIDVFEMNEDNFENDDVYRLNEILEEIEALMVEANDIVRYVSRDVVMDDIIYERWKAYPYNNIMSMLSSGTRYETSFSSIIEEIERAIEGNEDDEF